MCDIAPYNTPLVKYVKYCVVLIDINFLINWTSKLCSKYRSLFAVNKSNTSKILTL